MLTATSSSTTRRSSGSAQPLQGVCLNPRLHDGSQLINPHSAGRFNTQDRPTPDGRWGILSRSKAGGWFNAEYLPQLAAYVEATLELGYPSPRVLFELPAQSLQLRPDDPRRHGARGGCKIHHAAFDATFPAFGPTTSCRSARPAREDRRAHAAARTEGAARPTAHGSARCPAKGPTLCFWLWRLKGFRSRRDTPSTCDVSGRFRHRSCVGAAQPFVRVWSELARASLTRSSPPLAWSVRSTGIARPGAACWSCACPRS